MKKKKVPAAPAKHSRKDAAPSLNWSIEMSYNRMTREEAIAQVGVEAVKAVERSNVDFTGRVTDGTPDHGFTEFAAHEGSLQMVVFVDSEELDQVEELDQIDWQAAIQETAVYEITD